jgi:hypothetical protein
MLPGEETGLRGLAVTWNWIEQAKSMVDEANR